jgi:hypothetical protein
VLPGTSFRKDEVIFFHGQILADRDHFFRIVEVWDEERQRSFTFLAERLGLAATTIAASYRERWQVELFFKAIKQNLKIKADPSRARFPEVEPGSLPPHSHSRNFSSSRSISSSVL